MIELLVRMAGEGTRRISEMKAGEVLEVKGPLGRGFQSIRKKSRCWWPAVWARRRWPFLAEKLARSGGWEKGKRPVLFIGGRTKRELVALGEFRRTG